jgi:hypothetical protein
MNNDDKIKKLEEQINYLYSDLNYLRHLSKQEIRIGKKNMKPIVVKI